MQKDQNVHSQRKEIQAIKIETNNQQALNKKLQSLFDKSFVKQKELNKDISSKALQISSLLSNSTKMQNQLEEYK